MLRDAAGAETMFNKNRKVMERITMYLRRMMTEFIGFTMRKGGEPVINRLTRYLEEALRDGVIVQGCRESAHASLLPTYCWSIGSLFTTSICMSHSFQVYIPKVRGGTHPDDDVRILQLFTT